MKILIIWFAGKEYTQFTLASKTWKFDISDFNGEIPILGDKVLLTLPISRDVQSLSSRVFSTEQSAWTFKIVERVWRPEFKEIEFKVELDNPRDFYNLSDDTKSKLRERLDEDNNRSKPLA